MAERRNGLSPRESDRRSFDQVGHLARKRIPEIQPVTSAGQSALERLFSSKPYSMQRFDRLSSVHDIDQLAGQGGIEPHLSNIE